MSREEELYFAKYIASMPSEYRGAFDLEATRAHAEIVRRREQRKTHVEIWRELSERVVAICVVANDKPGLLSCISAALVTNHIDVVSAHAYCRTREDGSVEAIDFLWIRRLPNEKGTIPPIRAKDIVALADAIKHAAADGFVIDPTHTSFAIAESAASERVPSVHLRTASSTVIAQPQVPTSPTTTTTSSPLSSPTAEPAKMRANASAIVRFETDKDGRTVLTVEAVDRPGLLLAVTQALFRAGLQIVALRATTERGCAVDRFTLAEVDGTTLRRERLFTLQIAILGAIEEGTLVPALSAS